MENWEGEGLIHEKGQGKIRSSEGGVLDSLLDDRNSGGRVTVRGDMEEGDT